MVEKCQKKSRLCASVKYLRLISSNFYWKNPWYKSDKYFEILRACQISQVDQAKRVAIQIWHSSLQRSRTPPVNASGDDRCSSIFLQIFLLAWDFKLEQALPFLRLKS